MRHRWLLLLGLVCALAWGGSLPAWAQGSQSNENKKDTGSGITSYVEFDGSVNSLGDVFSLTPAVGYNFNRHFGVDLGMPIYMIRGSSRSGSNDVNGLGDPFLGLILRFPGRAVNYTSTLTGTVPVGSTRNGLSTGRVTVDWNNRFDHSFGRLTPFVDAGLANSVRDTAFFQRPFTTLGFNAHFEGGGEYELWRFFGAGASGWAIVPSGQQKVFSKLVPAGLAGGVLGHGVFGLNHLTTGGAELTRDEGFSTWVDAHPYRVLALEVAYTRSMEFNLNTVSFGIGLNVGQLVRESRSSH